VRQRTSKRTHTSASSRCKRLPKRRGKALTLSIPDDLVHPKSSITNAASKLTNKRLMMLIVSTIIWTYFTKCAKFNRSLNLVLLISTLTATPQGRTLSPRSSTGSKARMCSSVSMRLRCRNYYTTRHQQLTTRLEATMDPSRAHSCCTSYSEEIQNLCGLCSKPTGFRTLSHTNGTYCGPAAAVNPTCTKG